MEFFFLTDFFPLHLHLAVNHAAVFGWFGVVFSAAVRAVKPDWVSVRWVYLTVILAGILTIITTRSGDVAYHILASQVDFGSVSSFAERHEEMAESIAFGGPVGIVAGLVGQIIESRFPQNKCLRLVWYGFLIIFAVIYSGLLVYTAQLGGMIRHEYLR